MKSKIKKILFYGIGSVLAVILILAIYVKFFMPNVAAAPQLKVELTKDRIERGKYLANNVAVCMDCHSSRNWKKFSGPLVAGSLGKGGEYFGPEMGFPGEFYAKNLTPTNLGDWTDGEIFRAITTGVNKDGEAMFPVMPFLNYGKMDKEDVYDIIAYLRSLPPIENEVPDSSPHFPMNFILNTIPQEAQLAQKPHASDKVEYGAYLANAAGCIECHTPAKNGQLIREKAFAGGREFKMPNGSIFSPNITSDKETGIGNWSETAFVSRFKTFENPEAARELKEGEVNSIMPWTMYAGMKDSDLKAIYAYLQSLKPIKNKVAAL